MTRLDRQDGFTLLELLIAVTVLVIVTSQLFMVFSSQKRTFHANQRVLDVQEDARLVLDLIAFDTRQAGFMVPRIAAVASEDGGAAAADRFCVSDPGFVTVPETGVAHVLDSRSEHFTTGKVASFPSSPTGKLVTLDSLDVDGSFAYDGSGANDFDVSAGPRGLIVSSGQASVCAMITSINGNTLELDKDYDWSGFISGGAVLPQVRVAPAIIYSVNAGSQELRRNDMTLATSVEDLQVEYWVDNRTRNGAIDGAPNGDPTTEFPIHDLNANPGWPIDTTRIRRIRVSVLTRSDMREVNPDGTEKITGNSVRPALANRAADPVPDSFQRRRFVASVLPKNLF